MARDRLMAGWQQCAAKRVSDGQSEPASLSKQRSPR